MPRTTVFTVGHSNHSIDQFVALLQQHDIEVLVDIRRYPSSRRVPHFNRPSLSDALHQHGIRYVWLESLGGHRKTGLADSPNSGIKDEAMRHYADHMLGDDFRMAVGRLLELACQQRVAIMCAEKSFHDCHRKLTSDYLSANGADVRHILADGTLEPHRQSELTQLHEGRLTYPERHPLFD